jgi:glutathione peroxidase
MKKFLIIPVVILITLLLIKKKDMTWRQSFLKTVYPLIMLKSKWFPHEKSVQLNSKGIQPAISFYTLQATANNGAVVDFNAFKGKKVLIVNTASDCGFTAQYDELETLHQRYKDKLVIIGFPANDFKQQEQKDDVSIAEFCKVNFGVTFLLMQKSHVKGPEQNAVFQWLTDPEQNGWCNQQPLWNFSKYIINEEGVLVAFFAHTVSPLDKGILQLIP